MLISLNWLRELVELEMTPEALAEALTMAGFEVEGIEDRRTWAEGVVVGRIETAEPHPNADKLRVCTVTVGGAEPLQIVCGALNARAGLRVPVATVGAYLPKIDLKLRPTKLRGVRSEGMICSLAELGLAKESEGIHEFAGDPPLGADVRPLLGLDDVILDVTSTANRADALSMVGIAREVAALSGKTVCLPEAALPQVPAAAWVNVSEPKACPAYIGTLVRGVKVAPSPEWLQKRLQNAGMRPINNIVDVTNYVLLEWGQPLHAFDANTLAAGYDIGVRFAKAGETLVTLDGQPRELTLHNLMITSGDTPVAIAGVMGGKETEVRDTTTDIVLEAALFDRAVVRRSSRAQGLRSESSARYERGVNFAGLETACGRALQMILDLAGGEVVEMSAADNRGDLSRTLTLRLSRVRQLLGAVQLDNGKVGEIPPESVVACLESLGFTLTADSQTDSEIVWTVSVPPYRHGDVEREIDLIEEVARIYGYERIYETLPARTEFGFLPMEQVYARLIRELFRGVGLTEVVHSSLCSPTGSGQITLANPIAAEYGALRSDLLTGLIEACAYNLNQGNGCLNAFEIGRVFWTDEDGYGEGESIAGIFGGDPAIGNWQHTTAPLDWYAAKGVLETVFARLGIQVEFQPDLRDPRLHPGRTASLWIAGERLGTFGQLHPELRQAKDLPDEIYAFELDAFALFDALDRLDLPVFQPFSTYPKSDRDIAFFAPTSISVAEILRAIRLGGGELLEAVELFDEYRGEGVPPGKRSLAFRLIYRSSDRTLSEDDINPVHQKIRDLLETKFSATLRS